MFESLPTGVLPCGQKLRLNRGFEAHQGLLPALLNQRCLHVIFLVRLANDTCSLLARVALRSTVAHVYVQNT